MIAKLKQKHPHLKVEQSAARVLVCVSLLLSTTLGKQLRQNLRKKPVVEGLRSGGPSAGSRTVTNLVTEQVNGTGLALAVPLCPLLGSSTGVA